MYLLTLDLHLGPPQNSGVNIQAEVKLYLYSYFSSAPCLRVFSCKLVLSAFDVSTPSLITCLPLVPPSYFSQGSFFHFDFVLLPLFTFIIFVIFAKFFFFLLLIQFSINLINSLVWLSSSKQFHSKEGKVHLGDRRGLPYSKSEAFIVISKSPTIRHFFFLCHLTFH